MRITPAYTVEHFETIEALARRIVPEFYGQLIPPSCCAYLLQGYTSAAMEAQVLQGYRHYLVEVERKPVGCFALHEEERTMVLTQFYLLQEFRRRGLGQAVMDFVHEQAAELRADRIELLVLRKNDGAVGLYRKNGYFIAAEVLTPMGEAMTVED